MFCSENADYVCGFLECLTVPDGGSAGQPFQLMEWQRSAVSQFYGEVREDGLRQYRYLYLEIPKKNGKLRPLSIPTMTDRAMQTLYRFALEPIAETTADTHSYGFRPKRCVQDAIERCFNMLSRKRSAAWILEGDIKGCFDNISHEWILKRIPMDKAILRQFLKSGYIGFTEKRGIRCVLLQSRE